MKRSSPESLVPRARGGPDAFGYEFIDSQESDGPVYASEYVDISSSGTAVTFGDYNPVSVWGATNEGHQEVQIGFPFTFYGNSYTSVWVNTNFFLKFGGPTYVTNTGAQEAWVIASLPTTQQPNIIAVNWQDPAVSSARYATLGTAPNRVFIVYWNTTGETREVKLYENGQIVMLFPTVTSTNYGTTGVQNSTGTVGLQYGFNGSPNAVVNNRAIRFFAGTPPDPPTNLIQSGTPNGAAGPIGFVSDATAYFRATVTDPDAADLLGIEVEILPANLTFQSSVTGQTARTAAANLVPSGSVAEASYVFDGNPFGGGDYQWRVRGIDLNGNESPWVTFSQTPIQVRVDLSPPPTPQPVSPLPGQATVGGDVRFVWQPVADVGPAGLDFYEIEASLSAGFAVLQGTDSFTATQGTLFLPTSDLPYYWRVRAVDNGGNASAWSAPIQFFTKLDDGINHGGGDCATSAGTQPGTILSILVGMLSLSAVWVTRRRRARTG